MEALILVPWAETEWSAAGRLAGRTAIPLTEAGVQTARFWSDRLAASALKAVYTSNQETSLDIANIISKRTGASKKTIAELAEVDLGLWDGLTSEELKRRYPKIFKKWKSDPSSVSPPEGEDLEHAVERLRPPVEKLTRRPGKGPCAVVLGPMAFALTRCWIESADLSELGSMGGAEPLRYDVTDSGITGPGVPLRSAASGSDLAATSKVTD